MQHFQDFLCLETGDILGSIFLHILVALYPVQTGSGTQCLLKWTRVGGRKNGAEFYDKIDLKFIAEKDERYAKIRRENYHHRKYQKIYISMTCNFYVLTSTFKWYFSKSLEPKELNQWTHIYLESI